MMFQGRKVRRALAAIAGALVLLFVAGLLIFNSQVFHRFLLSKIIAKAEAGTGARLEIGHWAVAWRPLTANFYDVVVHGQGRVADPPVFQARHIGVSLGVLALLRRQIDLYAIVVDGPVLRVQVDEQGRSNVPRAPESSATSQSSFSLLVRHVVIADGWVRYNDQSIPLSAELQDFHAQAVLQQGKKVYRGRLAYGDGWVAAKQYNPLRHLAQIDFEASPDEVTISSLVLSTARSRLTARARLTHLAKPDLQGSYEGVVSTLDVARILKNPSLPEGDLALSGSLSFHYVPGQPFLRTAGLQGRLSSAGLALGTGQMRTSLNSVRGSYRLQNADLHVDNFAADLLGGHLTAGFEMLQLDQTPRSRVSMALRGVSLEKLTQRVPAESLEKLPLAGRISLEAQAQWSGSIRQLLAHAHLDVHGPPPQAARPHVVAVNGVVNVDYDGARETAAFGQSTLRIGKTELRMSGTLSRQSNLDVTVTSFDLHELKGLVGPLMVSSESAGKPNLAAYDFEGTAQVAARISGRPTDPLVHAQLSSSDLRMEGVRLRAVRANLNARSTAIEIQDGYLQSSDQDQINFSGQAKLAEWSLTPDSSISVHAKVAKVSLASVERLAKLRYPLSGDLAGDLSIEGSRQRPEGHGSLQLTHASVWNEPIDSLAVEFQGGAEAIQSKAQLKFPAGMANAQLSYWLSTQRYDLTLNTSHLALERLANLQQRAGNVRGSLTANVSGQGTLSDPQLTATVEIPQLQAGEETLSGLEAKAQVAGHHADLSLATVVAQGSVQLKGGVDLHDGYNTDATLEVRALPLGPILARYFPGATQDVQGQTEIHAWIKGPLENPARLEARVEIPTWNLAYKTVQVANEGPLRLDYHDGAVNIEQAKIKGTGTELTLQGVIPVQNSTPWNLAANGTVDASLLQVFYPDAHASGHLEVNWQRRGASSPVMQGQIRLVDTSFSSDSLPLGFSGVNGQCSISGNRIELTSLNGSAGGGTFTGTGFYVYGAQSNFAVDLHAKGVRVISNGLRTILDSNLRLAGTPQGSELSGDVLVDRLTFQQGVDLSELASQFSEPSAVSTPSTFASHMRLKVAVNSATNLNPTSSQLSIQGTVNLTLSGTAANPVVLGRVALTAGEIYFNGKRFEIQNGSIVFANPVRTEPVLNIYVKTTVEQYNITINFVGTLDQLRTTYTSDPALPPLDIINLLAFGQTTAEKASQGSTPLSVGAESALASQVGSQVAKNVQSLTGISRLTIDPLLSGSQNPGAQVSVQQRVTGSILVTFTSDVTSTQRQGIELQYEPKRRWRISILRDQNGGYGLDVGFRKAF